MILMCRLRSCSCSCSCSCSSSSYLLLARDAINPHRISYIGTNLHIPHPGYFLNLRKVIYRYQVDAKVVMGGLWLITILESLYRSTRAIKNMSKNTTAPLVGGTKAPISILCSTAIGPYLGGTTTVQGINQHTSCEMSGSYHMITMKITCTLHV